MNKYLYILLTLFFVLANVWMYGLNILQMVGVFIVFFVLLFKSPKFSSVSTLLYLLCCLLSIMVNDIPEFFKPGQRIVQYSFLILACSPMFAGDKVEKTRLVYFESVVLGFFLIAFSSGVLVFNGAALTDERGFYGFAQHPNFLGFFGMISVISLLALYSICEFKNKKIIIGVCLIASLVATMTAGSRICLAGAFIGCLVFLYLLYRDRIGKMVTYIGLGVALLVFSFPLYESYLAAAFYKQDRAQENESVTSSRDVLWATRLLEIERSPIFGVGCFAVDTSIKGGEFYGEGSKYYNPYDERTGSVELGSSFLGVMSQTGILGFIPFAILLISCFIKCYKTMKDTDSIVPVWLLALFAACMLHMIVEGYVTATGSPQCLFLWLLLAVMCSSPEQMEDEEDRLCYSLKLIDDEDYDEYEEFENDEEE